MCLQKVERRQPQLQCRSIKTQTSHTHVPTRQILMATMTQLAADVLRERQYDATCVVQCYGYYTLPVVSMTLEGFIVIESGQFHL